MTKLNFVTITMSCVLAGGLIAGVMSLARFSDYSSTGVMQVQESARVAMMQAMQTALSRGSLAEILQRPELNLYGTERQTLPLEDVIRRMRGQIAIRNERPGAGVITVRVTFRNPDPLLARRTTQALMDRIGAELATKAGVKAVAVAQPGQATLEGKRWKLVVSGMLGGLLLGMVCGAVWSIVRNREQWSLRRLGVFSAAGAVLGVIVAMLIPNVYVSNAVLRTARPLNAETVHSAILSDENLTAIIRSEGLYQKDAASLPTAELVRRMRENVQVRAVDGWGEAYVISFRDHDRRKSQDVTRALIGSWLKAGLVAQVRTEVLDPASDPVQPSSPNRALIALAGTLGGLLLGLAASRFRRGIRMA